MLRYFGDYTEFNPTEFLKNHSELNSIGDVNKISNILMKLNENVVKGNNDNYVWIDIRISLPNNNFDIPRWHMDGKFFINSERETQTKFITTLKGNGTLLVDLNKEKRKEFDNIYDTYLNKKRNIFNLEEKDKDEYKKQINKILNEERIANYELMKDEKYIQMTNDQGLIFVVGNDKSTIHSEPPIQSNRMFFSILVGNKEEIEDLKKRWTS